MTSTVSVVIPALNAEETIIEQLDALTRQDRLPDEIVIADNGSIDHTRSVVTRWADGAPIDLRVVDASEVKGAAFARNIGAEHARGDLFLFCDADDRVGDRWVSSLTEGLAHVELVAGSLDAQALNPSVVAGWRPTRDTSQLTRPEGFLPFCPSGNLGVRARTWQALGGMRSDYERSEDVEFSWRAQAQGFEVGYVPEATVAYRYRSSTSGTFRQAVASGRSAAQLFRDFRDAGMPGRRPKAVLRDWIWLPRRLSLATRHATRGVWVRRCGQTIGRIHGSLKYRVRYF